MLASQIRILLEDEGSEDENALSDGCMGIRRERIKNKVYGKMWE